MGSASFKTPPPHRFLAFIRCGGARGGRVGACVGGGLRLLINIIPEAGLTVPRCWGSKNTAEMFLLVFLGASGWEQQSSRAENGTEMYKKAPAVHHATPNGGGWKVTTDVAGAGSFDD